MFELASESIDIFDNCFSRKDIVSDCKTSQIKINPLDIL
jgi:hypothetical protein